MWLSYRAGIFWIEQQDLKAAIFSGSGVLALVPGVPFLAVIEASREGRAVCHHVFLLYSA
jgi:hypothetical protein